MLCKFAENKLVTHSSSPQKISQNQRKVFILAQLLQLTIHNLWGLQDKMTNRIKHRISLRTLRNQDRRCAFYDAILLVGSTHIEHIVPKGLHGEYTFEPLNLVSSCASCNSPGKKGESETVRTPLATRYCDNQFLIVHPYLDNPEDHIKYKDDQRIELDYAKCSQKGKATVDLFDWDNLWAQNNRVAIARTRDFDKATLKEILAISTYKYLARHKALQVLGPHRTLRQGLRWMNRWKIQLIEPSNYRTI